MNILSLRYKISSRVELPISLGKTPVNLFPDNKRYRSTEHSYNRVGKGPCRLLSANEALSSCLRREHMSSGSVPDRLFRSHLNMRNEELFKLIVPVK